MTAPGGLIHHWMGVVFVPGVSVGSAVQLLQDYNRRASIYASRIARSQLRSREGETFLFHLHSS